MVNRRQVITGAALTGLMTTVPSAAQACSFERSDPFTYQFWSNTWRYYISAPANSRDMIIRLVEGMLNNSGADISAALYGDAYMFLPPLRGNDPPPGGVIKRAEMVERLSKYSPFIADRRHQVRIMTIEPGSYVVVAALHGTKPPSDEYSFCGGALGPDDTRTFHAHMYTAFGDTGQITQMTMLSWF